VVTHARERIKGLRRDRIKVIGGIAKPLGQLPAHLDVELRRLLARHVAVPALDLGLEPLGVDERARVI
jgi:hypothetical protein